MKKQMIRKRARPPHEFANFGEVIESDTPLVPSPGGREEGSPEGDEPSDFEAEVESHRAGGRPQSEITGGPQGGTPGETVDGLDGTEEEIRHQAEDLAGSRREKL
jgi:hypothetical protein